LWQFSDHFYSAALNQNLDASHLNQKNADWFVGNNNTTPQNNSNNASNNNSTNNSSNTSNNSNINNTGTINHTGNNSNANNASNNTNGFNKPASHKARKHKKTTIAFTRINQSMTVKGGTGLNIYKHVPGDHRFAGHNGVKYASRRYAHRRVTIDLVGKRLSNGETYYRISAGLHRLGWINAKGLVKNITYSAYHGTKTVKANPIVSFHVHVTGSAFTNDGVTHKGSQLAHHKLTLTKRAKKDGWHSYYYKAYNRHHFVGWVYQSAFK
jgi:hypothetical protein